MGRDDISSKDVRGRLPLHYVLAYLGSDIGYDIVQWQPTSDILTGYIIPTHDMHQWLLLQFLVLLIMDEESVRNM